MEELIFNFTNDHTLTAKADLRMLNGQHKFLEVTVLKKNNRKYYINLTNVIYVSVNKPKEDSPISHQF